MSSSNALTSIFPDLSALDKPVQMSASIVEMRRELRLPLEYIKEPDQSALKNLADKILEPADNQLVILLAHKLSSRELNLVFPLLLHGPEADNSMIAEISSRLHLIIRERASLTLYVSGWLCFQYSYPNQTVARALTLLGNILNIRQQSGFETLIPIINEIIAPDTRNFTKQLTRRLSDLNLSLQNFMQDYGLAADLPLGAELLSQIFLQGSAAIFSGSHKLFAQVLRGADQATQSKLLQHFLSLKDIKTSVWNQYCQLIYRQFGEPDAEHPIWQKLKKKQRQSFRFWITAATIGSHCQNQPQKAHFYLRYAALIEKIESWNSTTLILSFPGFCVADNSQNPELAIYYSADQAERLQSGTSSSETRNPASPDIPRRRVDEAIRRNSGSGIIGLPFDEEGIRYSKIFLDMCLQTKPKPKFFAKV